MDLIAQGHDSHPSRFTRAFRQHSQILKVLGIFGILAATFAILLRSLLSEKEVLQAPSATQALESAQISQNSPLRLNPKDHIFRKPRALYHSWNITKEQRRPDGVLKSVYHINGLFPGPVLEARSGDRLIITVNNKLDNGETTSIHWHGLSMRNANNMDGVAGITQDPIRPGQSFVYEFDIEHDQHGTFWYHAHDGTQKADGMYGGLIVHKPADAAILDNDRQSTDEYLVIAGDWYHRSGRDALEFYMHPGSFGIEPVPDNIIINGRGNFNCSKVVPARPVDCVDEPEEQELLRLRNSTSLLRVINAGSYAPFSIKSVGSFLTPVAVDGHAIQCSTAQSVGVLPPGGRVDLLFHAEKTSATDEMAVELHLDATGFKYPNPVLTTRRSIKVECNQFAVQDNSNNIPLALERADVDLATVRSQGHIDDMPGQADETIVLYAITQKLAHLKNEPHGFINNTSWGQNDTSVPLIRLPEETRAQSYFIPHIQYNASSPLWVDLVLNNLDEEHHPFHLHGHSFYVLATYSSDYNWGSYNPFATSDPPGGPHDLVHPAKKDTLLVPRRGYAVLRFRADNPGIWMFHCHALWHEASGMAMALEIA